MIFDSFLMICCYVVARRGGSPSEIPQQKKGEEK
jgi:hypothetical protein